MIAHIINMFHKIPTPIIDIILSFTDVLNKEIFFLWATACKTTRDALIRNSVIFRVKHDKNIWEDYKRLKPDTRVMVIDLTANTFICDDILEDCALLFPTARWIILDDTDVRQCEIYDADLFPHLSLKNIAPGVCSSCGIQWKQEYGQWFHGETLGLENICDSCYKRVTHEDVVRCDYCCSTRGEFIDLDCCLRKFHTECLAQTMNIPSRLDQYGKQTLVCYCCHKVYCIECDEEHTCDTCEENICVECIVDCIHFASICATCHDAEETYRPYSHTYCEHI